MHYTIEVVVTVVGIHSRQTKLHATSRVGVRLSISSVYRNYGQVVYTHVPL